MSNYYPNIDDLKAFLPRPGIGGSIETSKALELELRRRYEQGSHQYASDNLAADGRTINRCMVANSLQEAFEELTDAIFNLLVVQFKESPHDIEWAVLDSLLSQLVAAWGLIHHLRGAYPTLGVAHDHGIPI